MNTPIRMASALLAISTPADAPITGRTRELDSLVNFKQGYKGMSNFFVAAPIGIGDQFGVPGTRLLYGTSCLPQHHAAMTAYINGPLGNAVRSKGYRSTLLSTTLIVGHSNGNPEAHYGEAHLWDGLPVEEYRSAMQKPNPACNLTAGWQLSNGRILEVQFWEFPGAMADDERATPQKQRLRTRRRAHGYQLSQAIYGVGGLMAIVGS